MNQPKLKDMMKNLMTMPLMMALTALTFMATPVAAETQTFVYSGGCFWCTEADSEKLDGVSEVISGFTGGKTPSPRYYPGAYGDHREAAQVLYDPAVISFEDLVRHVYMTVDYEDGKGQFCDRGRAYAPAIYYKTEEEKAIATRLAPPTSIVPVEQETEFFPVREEHQDYYKKQSNRYKFYRIRCGRDKRIEKLNKT